MAVVIKTAVSLAKIDSSLAESACVSIRNALNKGADEALHAATEVFAFELADLSDEIRALVISNITRVKAENRGSIDNIDLGISSLFRKNKKEAIECLEEILLANPNVLSIKNFNSIIHEILSSKSNTLNYILTRWFIKGDPVLCNAITEIVNTVHGEPLTLEIDQKALPNKDSVNYIYLARKSIGYLFIRPVALASILVSLLRVANDSEVLKDIEKLLFDPLLVNYPGEARKYLEDRKTIEKQKVSEILNSVIKRLDKYLENIRNMSNIPELLPSISQREAYMRIFNKKMSESYKKAMKGSIVEMIATKSVILYGRTSISYVKQGSSESSRVVIPMKKHSVEMEVPRREILDRYGLDYVLRIFRAERLVLE